MCKIIEKLVEKIEVDEELEEFKGKFNIENIYFVL